MRYLKPIISNLLCGIAFSLFGVSYCLNRYFGHVSYEQLIVNIQIGSKGLFHADSYFTFKFIKHCIILPSVYVLISSVLYKKCVRPLDKYIERLKVSPLFKRFLCSLHDFLVNKRVLSSVAFLLIAVLYLLYQLSFENFILKQAESPFIEENYKAPIIKKMVVPETKRNLVLIYVESLENTYSNKEIFNQDLLSSINIKTKDWLSFQSYRQLLGIDWTMSAIVSTQCGVPLKSITTALSGNNFGLFKSFMPNITCLGDVLKASGYHNVFMNGSDLRFSGKGNFLKTHGYEKRYGKRYWKSHTRYEFHGWGLSDDNLFYEAKHMLDRLEKSHEPFNLTLLTVDTHGPTGFVNKHCLVTHKNDKKRYLDIVNCTGSLLTDFIHYMEEKHYLVNTDVVIIGDHLTARVPAMSRILDNTPIRTIFNKFHSAQLLRKNREHIFHFDIFPSILYMLGYRFDENRLGLGVSAFGEPSKKVSFINEQTFNARLPFKSKKYLQFWGVGELANKHE